MVLVNRLSCLLHNHDGYIREIAPYKPSDAVRALLAARDRKTIRLKRQFRDPYMVIIYGYNINTKTMQARYTYLIG